MNIIYFNPDELRADTLGCYGHPLVKTPNIDRLAARGTLFEKCFVQHTVCSPSRCSFMTGWYPHTRGHRSLWHLLQPDEPNTLKYLKQNGYQVHYLGKNDLLSNEAVDDCIDVLYPQMPNWSHERRYDDPAHPGFMSMLCKPVEGEHADYHRVQAAVEFIRGWRAGDKPFMLFLGQVLPHCPYTAPEPWYSMYSPENIPPLLAESIENAPSFHRWIKEYRRLNECRDELEQIMAVYLGMVSYVDHMFGMLLDALDESAAADNTTVFFFSDHGDWAGDRGLIEKWPSALDDRLVHVPLIIAAPGGKAGHRVAEPVELFDIAPTVAALTDTPLRHSQYGHDLTSQLNGEPGDPDRAVFAEGGYDQNTDIACFEHIGGIPGEKGHNNISAVDNPLGHYYPKGIQQLRNPESICRSVMIRTIKHKLIRREHDVSELYDLEVDPGELNNLYNDPAYQSLRSELNERLLLWYLRTSDVTPWGRDVGNPFPALKA